MVFSLNISAKVLFLTILFLIGLGGSDAREINKHLGSGTFDRTANLERDGSIDQGFSPVLSLDNDAMTSQIVTLPDGRLIVVGNFKVVNGIQKFAIARLNSDGSVDDLFDVSVLTTSTQFPTARIDAVAVLPSGKLIIGGWFTSINGFSTTNIARLNADGTTDTTFTTGTGFDDYVSTLAVHSDGKIYVGGNFSSYAGTTRRYLARLHENGSLDAGFNNTIVSFWAQTMHSIVPLSDGKVFIQGKFSTINTVSRPGLARLNSDGSLDASFVVPGTYAAFNFMNSFAIRPSDGKIYIGGSFEVRVSNVTVCKDLCRLNSDGTADSSYIVQFGTNTSVSKMLFLPSEKLLINGNFSVVNGTPRNGMARLNGDGSIDSSFNPNLSLVGSLSGLSPMNDGRVFLTGQFTKVENAPVANIARISSDGQHEISFVPTLSAPCRSVSASAMQPDGKVVLAGRFDRANGHLRFGMARINRNGSTDSTFNASVLPLGASNTPATINFIDIQPDGKILIGGDFYSINETSRRFVARLNTDGSVDTSFVPNLTYEGSGPGFVRSIAVQSNNKILVGGNFTAVDGQPRRGYARLNADGSFDSSFVIPLDAVYFPSVSAIAIQPDGRIIFGGDLRLDGVATTLSVIRAMPDGGLDPTFTQPRDVTKIPYLVQSLTLQTDGRVLVGGTYTGGPGPRPLLSRLLANGASDSSFQQPSIGIGFFWENIVSILIAPNREIVIGGRFSRINGVTRYNLARLAENGSLDYSLDVPNVRVEASGAGTVGYNMVTQDQFGQLFVVGLFDRIGSVFKTGVARLSIRNESIFDFDGDGRTDLAIFRPNGASSEWWWNKSSTGGNGAVQFGDSTDVLAPVDFTGDGKTDVAFWRPSTGQWFVLRSEDFSFYAFPFGATGDVPVPADYDGDGTADAAVFRESSLTWFISKSSGGTDIVTFGAAGDKPVNADYDGDGKADIAIFRPNGANGAEWWIRRSSNGGVFATQFGNATDKAVAGDFTGDGKADVAFWRPSTGFWNILRSEDFSYYAFPFGASGDAASPGDYDGDGKLDAAVFRPASSTWFVNRSTAGTLIQQFGIAGDVPVSNAFVR